MYPLFYFLSVHCTHVAFINCLLKKLDDDDDCLMTIIMVVVFVV